MVSITDQQPRVLFLTPIVPAVTGRGLAMRAGFILKALARSYRVSLLLAPLSSSPGTRLSADTTVLCEQVAELSIDTTAADISPFTMALAGKQFGSKPASHPVAALDQMPFSGQHFDLVHAFRLITVPYIDLCLDPSAPRPTLHLDIDDIESKKYERMATIYRLNGDQQTALLCRMLARRIRAFEDQTLPHFDRVYVCSKADQEELEGRVPERVCVIPNAVRMPAIPLPKEKRKHEPFTFLFVGTLDYYPNVDALNYFCMQVLPVIRSTTTESFKFVIIGGGAVDALQHLREMPDVHLVGAVPNVESWYRDADAAVVPIRAGGGTRIKILEAFAWRTPVVSTTLGVEGIEASVEQHVLVGDTSEAFAQQCVRLMREPALATMLAERAAALVQSTYSEEVVLQAVTPLLDMGSSAADCTQTRRTTSGASKEK